MIDLYCFIKRNRAKKKWKVYQQALMLSFDWTVIFYAVVFLGYILFAILSEGNLLTGIAQRGAFLQNVTFRTFSYGWILLPLVYLLLAFAQPGLAFSSTEYTLTIQPVRKHHLLGLLAVQRWLGKGVVYTIIGGLYGGLYGISASHVTLYILLLLGMDILMTPLQWKFFQLSLLRKLACLLLLVLLNSLVFFVDIVYLVGGLVTLLVLCHIICIHRLVHQIHWQKVTAAVDFKLWNMPLITQMTKVTFEKPRKYTIWQRMRFYQKPFHPDKHTVYHRLWQLHLAKHKKYILQLTGVLLLLLLVTVFLKQALFLAAIFIASQVYNNLMAAVFKDRFQEGIVAILPWSMQAYRDTFLIWAFSIGSIVLVPAAIYLWQYNHWTSWLHVMLFAAFFVIQLMETLHKQMYIMDESIRYDEHLLRWCAAGMTLTFLSMFHVVSLVLASVIAVIVFILKRRKTRPLR